jgi:hypothetical protein
MAKQSAGILLYRGRGPALRLLLVHPGGPFWAKKDLGAWSIPKGEYEEGESSRRSLGARRRQELRASSASWFSRAGRSSPLLLLRATSMRARSRQTCSRWSGRRRAVACNPSQRSIAPNGSRSRRRARRSCLASAPSSTGCSIASARSLLRGLQRLGFSTAFWGCAGGAIRARFQR